MFGDGNIFLFTDSVDSQQTHTHSSNKQRVWRPVAAGCRLSFPLILSPFSPMLLASGSKTRLRYLYGLCQLFISIFSLATHAQNLNRPMVAISGSLGLSGSRGCILSSAPFILRGVCRYNMARREIKQKDSVASSLAIFYLVEWKEIFRGDTEESIKCLISYAIKLLLLGICIDVI